MKIETVDVVAHISSTDLELVIDVFDAILENPGSPTACLHQNGRDGSQIARLVTDLKEFTQLASKTHPSGYSLRPKTKTSIE